MEEADWLQSDDPGKLLDFAMKRKPRPSLRQLRLYTVACCREMWEQLEATCRQAVEVAERFADAAATGDELAAAHRTAMRPNRKRFDVFGFIRAESKGDLHGHSLARWAWQATEGACRPARPMPKKTLDAARMYGMLTLVSDPARFADYDRRLADLARDLFGNPFRRDAIDPAWLRWHDGTIPRLAQQMHDSRDFAAMPILADALEEAGCTNAGILDHCRGPGPHGRGCWLVDLVLARDGEPGT